MGEKKHKKEVKKPKTSTKKDPSRLPPHLKKDAGLSQEPKRPAK